MKKLTFPETMLVMLEQSQAKVKELGLALEQAQETIDRLEMVAQTEQQKSELRANEIKKLEKMIAFRDELDNLNQSL